MLSVADGLAESWYWRTSMLRQASKRNECVTQIGFPLRSPPSYAVHKDIQWVYWVCTLDIPKGYNHHHWQLPCCHSRFSPDLATCCARLATVCTMLRAAPLGCLVHKGRGMKMKGPESSYHERWDCFESWTKCQCFGALMCNAFLDGKGTLYLCCLTPCAHCTCGQRVPKDVQLHEIHADVFEHVEYKDYIISIY